MTPEPDRYEPSVADVERLQAVHRLITAHPESFREAGQLLDRGYSVDACLKRDLASLPYTKERGEKARELWARRVEKARAKLKLWKRERFRQIAARALLDYSGNVAAFRIPVRADWKRRGKRCSAAIQHFIDRELKLSVPIPDWDWASTALLLFWIVCDERAGRGPQLTDFQRWPWDGTTGEPAGRASARYGVRDGDWPRFVNAVDLALAVARTRGLSSPEQSPVSDAEAAPPPAVDRVPLSDAARAVYTILCGLPETEGRTARELVKLLANGSPRITVDVDRVKRHIRNELLPYGLENKRGSGYFVPMSRRRT